MDDDPRLDEIETPWSLFRMAHDGPATAAGAACDALVLRYNRAIRGYVGALVRDEDAADEVAQDAVVRLLQGEFDQATPERGRFRDLLKVSVKNMVRTYWRRQQRQSRLKLPAAEAPHESAANDALDQEWLGQWRAALLDVAWRGLEEYQRLHAGNVSYALLRLRADHPDDDGESLSRRLGEAVGRPLRADAVRQQLRRARLRFAQLLTEEIARSLDDPTAQRVEEELVEVGLMEYVREFLPSDWQQHGELRDAGPPWPVRATSPP